MPELDGVDFYDALVARDADRAAAADVMHLGIAEEWLRKFLAEGHDAAVAAPTSVEPPD